MPYPLIIPENEIDEILDTIFEEIDQLLREAKFDEVDFILRGISPSQTNTNVLLGYLTICVAAKSKLPHYSEFFTQAKLALIQRGEYSDDLLKGLE